MQSSFAADKQGLFRLWWIVGAAGCAVTIAVGLLLWYRIAPRDSCEAVYRKEEYKRAAALCAVSFERARNWRDLLWAARAHTHLREWREANQLARQLLTGPFYADALNLLGFVAHRERQSEAAIIYTQAALAAHQIAGDLPGITADLTVISQTVREMGDSEMALKAVEQSIALARRSNGLISLEPAYLAKADVLRTMGDRVGAFEALRDASDNTSSDCSKAWVHIKRGALQMDAAQTALAEVELSKAEQLNQHCGSVDVEQQVLRNQAWLLWRTDPSSALARLEALERIVMGDQGGLLLRSYMAANRGDLRGAEAYLEQAAAKHTIDDGWDWDLMRARAELLEAPGGLWGDAFAALFYRVATSTVERLRASAQVRSAHMVASYRASYDGLISLWARHQRWREALSVIFELDASDMLRATAAQPLLPAEDPVTADVFQKEPPIPIPLPSVDAVLEAWKGRDLVIVVAQEPRQIGPGGERAYRLHVRDGKVTGEDVGSAAQARKWAEALYQDPEDHLAARELGRLIVPKADARRDDQPLEVLLIGVLSKVPLPALRDEGASLIAEQRPLVRVQGLRADAPETEEGGGSVVVADPLGDLPRAVSEGFLVVEALTRETSPRRIHFSGSKAATPATKARLWEADGAGLLHLAAHVSLSTRSILLADGEVKAEEIVRRRLAPRLAVLASCGSAAATDEEGWGSIAAALLDAGTSMVVATDRRVPDEDSLRIMRGFYAQPDWRKDPARALARVQVAESKRPAPADPTIKAPWAAFSVLGRPPMVERKRGISNSARRPSMSQGVSP